MIQHYHAPYILQKFQPHFTLLTNLPSSVVERQRVVDSVEQTYHEQVPSDSIELQSLFAMRRPQISRPWQIAKEVRVR